MDWEWEDKDWNLVTHFQSPCSEPLNLKHQPTFLSSC
jgi:hypothetical protein